VRSGWLQWRAHAGAAGCRLLDSDGEHAGELNLELKQESLYKQQTEVIKFLSTCMGELKACAGADQSFWRSQLAVAQAQTPLPAPKDAATKDSAPPAWSDSLRPRQAQLAAVQAKLPAPHHPAQPADTGAEVL
jgi:hypothetical protein